MIPIITSIFKKPPEDLEKTSPLPYRIIMIGLILSGLVWVALMMAIGTGPVIIGIIALTMIVFPGILYAMAESGGNMGNSHGPMIYAWSTFPGVITTIFVSAFGLIQTAPTEVAVTTMFTTWGGMIVTFISSWAFIMAWKIQRESKVAKGDIFKAILITIGFTAVVHTIGGFIWGSLFPVRADAPRFSPGWGGFFTGREIGFLERGTIYPYVLSSAEITNMVGLIIGSIILMFLMYEARRRVSFLRWLNPVAILLALWAGYYIWVAMFLSVVIKYLLMKTGGAPAVEKGKHFAIGLFAAFCFANFFEAYIGGRLTWYILGFGQGWPAWPGGR
jgi:hypothetical protein